MEIYVNIGATKLKSSNIYKNQVKWHRNGLSGSEDVHVTDTDRKIWTKTTTKWHIWTKKWQIPTSDTVVLLVHLVRTLHRQSPQSLSWQELLVTATAASQQLHVARQCTRRHYLRLVVIVDSQLIDSRKDLSRLVAIWRTMVVTL